MGLRGAHGGRQCHLGHPGALAGGKHPLREQAALRWYVDVGVRQSISLGGGAVSMSQTEIRGQPGDSRPVRGAGHSDRPVSISRPRVRA